MKKKFLVVLVSAIMGLQLVGCGSSTETTKDSTDNKAVTTATPVATHTNKVVDDDSVTNDIAEAYLEVKEKYLEILQTKDMDDWDETKKEVEKDLKNLKSIVQKDNSDNNKAIDDIEQLITKYQNVLDGKGFDSTGIQDLESQVKQLLFYK